MDQPQLATASGGDAIRVVIASESRITDSVMEQLFVIRTRFLAADDSRDVHAAVLHSSGWFVIWIEGPQDGIDAVMKRSKRDTRHTNLRVIHRSTGRRTLTDRLTLATTQGADRPQDFARRIESIEATVPHLGPASIWRRLSAPSMLGEAGEAPSTICRRIALMGCDHNGTIDVLRRVADRFGARVVYQRFASGKRHSLDVGGAYVDLDLATHGTRVQVLSRRALDHRMVRESMAGMNDLALLLGSLPGPAIELADSLTQAAQQGASLPDLRLVAACPIVGASVGDLLRIGAKLSQPAEVIELEHSQIVDYVISLTDHAEDCVAC